MNFPVLLIASCACLIASSWATVNVDLSNVDFAKFKYFKNFPSVMHQAKANVLGSIGEHFERKKAVLVYFRNLVNNPFYEKELKIEFDPNFGAKWKSHFERHYGKKGELLVELLGKGHSPEKLRYHGAIPNYQKKPQLGVKYNQRPAQNYNSQE